MSTKRELNMAKAEITELRRLYRRVFPSGNRESPDRMWKLIRRLADHIADLNELSDPIPSRPVATSASVNIDQDGGSALSSTSPSAERPLFPGVWLAPEGRGGDRNLYHRGRAYQKEVERLGDQLEALISQSADWLRGLDMDPVDLPPSKRDRCECGELMATIWRLCPYCGVPR